MALSPLEDLYMYEDLFPNPNKPREHAIQIILRRMTRIVSVLKELNENRPTVVLPTLQNIFVEGLRKAFDSWNRSQAVSRYDGGL